MFFAGGGIQGGRVIGSSDKIAAYPASGRRMAATMYHCLGIPQTAACTMKKNVLIIFTMRHPLKAINTPDPRNCFMVNTWDQCLLLNCLHCRKPDATEFCWVAVFVRFGSNRRQCNHRNERVDFHSGGVLFGYNILFLFLTTPSLAFGTSLVRHRWTHRRCAC